MLSRGASRGILFTEGSWQIIQTDIGFTDHIHARHTCSMVQKLGGIDDIAYIYRYTVKTLDQACPYCHSIPPDEIKTLFRLIT